MGLIKAGLGALGGTFADQWKEYFYCEAMDMDVLMTKGQKRTSSRSSNTRGNDNIISNGSVIAVADGQCMIIVEQGKIVEVCAEPGEFTYDTSTEPSIFAGSLGEGIKNTFSVVGKRFTFGGEAPKDQRVYYFNTKELMDNKFGTANPIPFKVVDDAIGLRVSLSVRCSGVYSYKIADPLLFYTRVCGNVSTEFTREQIDSQLKTEFISALQPAFGRLSAMKLLPEDIMAHTMEVEDAMREQLSSRWGDQRGLQVVSVALGSVTLPEEDQERLKNAQMYSNPAMAAGMMAAATADSMKTAAGNSAGAMTGFMGMGMAMNQMGGMNGISNLYSMGQNQNANQNAPQNSPVQNVGDTWKCACGNTVQGKFCTNCGNKKPEPATQDSWICPTCGKPATGKFCAECGARKPVSRKCDKCGYVFPEGSNAKFCPECGDIVDSNDM